MRDNKDLSFNDAVDKIKENKEINKELRNLPPVMLQGVDTEDTEEDAEDKEVPKDDTAIPNDENI
jgi:hypothetical protein